MKKLLILFTLFILFSCGEKKPVQKYTLVYKIYYTTTDVRTKTYGPITWAHTSSSRGTNDLWIAIPDESGHRLLEETSAPIEIVSYIKIK